jgi:ATP-dependent DNA helicase RecQ
VLRGERQVKLRRDPAKLARVRPARSAAREPIDMPPDAAPVFDRLRAWRGATAKESGMPAYVIFHDTTLREIAARRPSTLAELGTISGIGENKLAKYGEGVLAVLTDAGDRPASER